jgi:hypothetical protein
MIHKNTIVGIALGVGATLVAPWVAPVASAVVRPA